MCVSQYNTINFHSNKKVGTDADHWLLTYSKRNGDLRCVI